MIDTNFLHGIMPALIAKASEKRTNLKRVFQESIGGELDFKLQLQNDTLAYKGG